MISMRKAALLVGALVAVTGATPALANAAPSTRLVSCGEASCLMVSGERATTTSEVRVNGHRVDVQGNRKWHVSLPVETVRDWSVPFARRIEVSTGDPLTSERQVRHAILPIGLLGHVPDLASLVITLH
jgi:hypothetical protein